MSTKYLCSFYVIQVFLPERLDHYFIPKEALTNSFISYRLIKWAC